MKKILFPALIVFLIAISSAHGQSPIYEVQLDNCIDLRTESIKVIENNEQLIGAVRNDASRDRCLEKLAEQDLDLFANTLLGVSISSGYCHRPSGLAYEIDTDLILSVSTLRISYTDNDGVRCAALRRYDLWC